MTTYKRAISGFILRFLGLLSSYIFTFLVINYHSEDNWGNFTLTLTIVSFLVLLVKFGFDLTLLKFTSKYISTDTIPEFKFLYLKSIKPLIIFGFLLTLGLYFSSEYICTYIEKPLLIPFLKIGSFAVVPLAISIINAECVKGFEKSNMYIFVQFVGIYFFAALIFLLINNLVQLNYDETVIIAFTSSCYIVFLISLFFLNTIIRAEKPINSTNTLPSYKDLFSIALPFFVTNLMVVLIDWTDVLLLGLNVSSAELGQYNLTLKISNLMLLPVMVAATIAGPKVALSYELKDFNQLKQESSTAVKLTLVLGILTYVGLIVGWPIIDYVFKGKLENMFWIFLVLISGQFLTTLLGPNDIFLQLTGNQNKFKTIMLISASFNVIGNIIFIPMFGIWSACVINLITKLIWNLSAYYFFRKRILKS